MSDTPRTDQYLRLLDLSGHEVTRGVMGLTITCRQLERELTASLARETKLREALIKLDKIYRSEMDEPENNPRPKWLSEALALSTDGEKP